MAGFAASEPVITCMAGFALPSRFHLPGGHISARASQIGADGLSTHSLGLLDLSQRPPRRPKAMICCFCSSFKTPALSREATYRYCQCPGRFF
jgi:hypothetical protein